VASKSLSFLLFGEDVSAGKAFKKVAADAEASGASVKGAFNAGSLLGVGLLAGGLGLAAKSAMDFQSKMLLLQTQAGQSAATVKTMSSAVLTLAGQTGTAPDQLATSLYHVVSTGLKGADALNAVKIAAEGAKVGNADLEETTNALTSAVASGIPGVQNMSSAMGSLNAIVGAGDMKMSDLNEAMGSGLLSVVKGFGLSLSDTGAALAVFGDNNIRGADAATALKQAVMAMAKPIAGGETELKKLGITTGQLATDMQHGGLNAALMDLKGHLDKSGVSGTQLGEVLTVAFGRKAGPGMAILLGQMPRFEQKLSDITQGGKNFGAAWDTWMKSNQGQMDLLKEKTAAFEIELGQKLLPILNTGMQFANAHAKALLGIGGAVVGLKLAIGGVKIAQDLWNGAAKVGVAVQGWLGGATAATTTEIEASRGGLLAWATASEGANAAAVTTGGFMTKLGGAAMLAKGSIVAALALSVADMNKGNKPKNTAQLTDTVNFLKPGTTALKEKTDATKAGTDATKAMSAADKDSAAAAKLQAQYEADSATQIAAAAKAALSLKTGLADLNAQTLDVKDSQLAFLDSISSLTNVRGICYQCVQGVPLGRGCAAEGSNRCRVKQGRG
jgi:TP901 family phage tail tape measure protein